MLKEKQLKRKCVFEFLFLPSKNEERSQPFQLRTARAHYFIRLSIKASRLSNAVVDNIRFEQKSFRTNKQKIILSIEESKS